MRIAIVSTPFVRVPPAGYGGTELFCGDLAEGLHARRHDVTLFATGDSCVSCRLRWLYARPEWPPNPYDEVRHLSWVVGEIAKGGFDLVHLNCSLALAFARFVEVPLVYTIHHHRMEAASRLYQESPSTTFVAISRRQLELEVALASAVVIHHGVTVDRYPPSVRDEGYLLHLGRYAPEKGTHLAIDAAAVAGLPIKLAGRVHEQDAAYFAAQVAPRLGRPGVEELGEAGPARKVGLLRGARAVLLPLQWEEPFGLVAIEAMLCGTPVLGFPRGSFPEIVDEGVTGFLAPADDVEALGRLARGLAGFDRRACAARARERFSTTRMCADYEALYARVLARRGVGAVPRRDRGVGGDRRPAAPVRAPDPARRSSAGR